MAKKVNKKVVTVRTVTPLKKSGNKNDRKNVNKQVQKKSSNKGNIKTVSSGNTKSLKSKTSKTNTGFKANQTTKGNNKTGTKKTLKAAPIQYNKEALIQLRRTVRKKDGTFLKKSYYEKILKKLNKAENQSEADNILIELRNKNPKIRYYSDRTSDTLHFQTGSFIDRLKGQIETKRVKKGKLNSELVFTGDLKRGAKIVIIDLKGDKYTFRSIAKANDLFYKNNNIINSVVDLLRDTAIKITKSEKTKEALRKKKKGTGIYFKVPETVTTNSEAKTTAIKYDFSKLVIDGSNVKEAERLLNELKEDYNSGLEPDLD